MNKQIIYLGDKKNNSAKFYNLKTPLKKPLKFIEEMEFLVSICKNCKLAIFLSDSNVFTLLAEDERIKFAFEKIAKSHEVEPFCINKELSYYSFVLNETSLNEFKQFLNKSTSELLIADNIFLINEENLVLCEYVNFYDGVWSDGASFSYNIDKESLKRHYFSYSDGVDLMQSIDSYPYIEKILEYSFD